jgi:hypothetical protein
MLTVQVDCEPERHDEFGTNFPWRRPPPALFDWAVIEPRNARPDLWPSVDGTWLWDKPDKQ